MKVNLNLKTNNHKVEIKTIVKVGKSHINNISLTIMKVINFRRMNQLTNNKNMSPKINFRRMSQLTKNQ